MEALYRKPDQLLLPGTDVGQVTPACRKETKTAVLLSDTHAASISGCGSPRTAAGVKDNLRRRELTQHMEGEEKKECLFSHGKTDVCVLPAYRIFSVT